MSKQCITSKNSPPPMGPYSHAVKTGNLLFVSGQGPTAKDGSGVVRGTIEQETKLALENLKSILEDAGSGLEQVVKVNAYLADMGNFARFNEVYKTYFPQDCPARTTIQAGRLPLDFQIEVEAVAVVPEG